MKVTDKVAVITGGASGIGRAHKTFGKDGPFPLAEWNRIDGGIRMQPR